MLHLLVETDDRAEFIRRIYSLSCQDNGLGHSGNNNQVFSNVGQIQRECITRTRRGDNPYSKSFRLFADQRIVARASFDQIRDGD